MSSRADVNRGLQFGMAPIMPRFAIVMRTLFIAVAILTITGVFPAMASLDSCAMKPCCAHEKAIAAAARPACCNETSGSMTPAKPLGLTQRTGVRERPIVAASATNGPIPTTAHDHARRHVASRSPARPPETFSILLI
jgi:hypothetical protein